jgi:hypothetical protein
MVLQTNSVGRAIGAAKFFASRLGAGCTLLRGRIVNRLFAAEEAERASLAELMKALDQDVTVRDPREAEAELERDFKGVRTPEELERVMAARLERRIESRENVPLVEDFPLAAEEETPDFEHLTMTLQLRFARAAEHWRGHTDLTLTALIVRLVKEGNLPSLVG